MKGSGSNTPLANTAWTGHKKVAEFLLDRKENIEAHNHDVVLFLGAHNGDIEIPELFLAAGGEGGRCKLKK